MFTPRLTRTVGPRPFIVRRYLGFNVKFVHPFWIAPNSATIEASKSCEGMAWHNLSKEHATRESQVLLSMRKDGPKCAFP